MRGTRVEICADGAFDATIEQHDLECFERILESIKSRQQKRKTWIIRGDKREAAFEALAAIDTLHLVNFPHSVVTYKFPEAKASGHMAQISINASGFHFEVSATIVAEHGQADAVLAKIDEAIDGLRADISDMAKVQVAWYYNTQQGLQYNYVTEMVAETVHDEAYPAIHAGVDKFIEEYLASGSSVLLLSGTHGCGKSRLIRYLVMTHALKQGEQSANVMYTTDLMMIEDTDQFFMNFRTGDFDFLVLEDVDVCLESRKETGNKIMHKLLAASDGFLSNPNRKIILSTNLSNVDVDEALLRPGRCFGQIQLDALGVEQALGLARAIDGSKAWGEKIQEDMTVASVYEIVNDGKSYNIGGGQSIGFTPSRREAVLTTAKGRAPKAPRGLR